MKKMFLRALALAMCAMMLMTSCGLATSLRFGMKNDQIVVLQTALKKLGYYKKTIDGNFGTGTHKAVKEFQKDENLKVDGIAGESTLALLEELTGVDFDLTNIPNYDTEDDKDDEKPKGLFAGNYDTLKYGKTGNRVSILQRALMALGFKVTVDGTFGSTTHAAVKKFQGIVGLTQDGKAGKKTLQKLEKYFDDNGKCISGPIASFDPAEPEVDPDAPEYGMPDRTLRYGATGLDVKYVMQRLYDLEYYNKKVDEKFGSGMLKAVKAFQKKNSLTVDGVVGPTTLKKLFSDSALDADDPIPPKEEKVEEGRTLSKGMKGEDVKAVQVRLAALGYYDGKLDGSYGDATRDAVKLFQARNGMTVDGKVGPRTLAKLNASSAVPAWGTGTALPEGDG
ncbi:MAG: peptidoglycan-binding protein [Clostridia bacterium]|nr:peptidoglycan-binding protein [Clostridia bacterium]